MGGRLERIGARRTRRITGRNGLVLLAVTLAAMAVPIAAAPAATAAPATAAAAPSWRVTRAFPAITTSVSVITCGSAATCQAVSGTVNGTALLGTADGGRTWQPEHVPAGRSVNDVA